MENKHICKTCGYKTPNTGHLCNPKTNNTKQIYICQDCGLITTEKTLICKPKILKLK